MKIKHFFGLAVLAAMTASCSSNDELANGGNGNGEITNEVTEGYAAFNINLPSVSGTRADDPEFDKGDANEYDVNNATLLIFKAPASTTTSTTENDYTFVESVDLGSMEPWEKDGADNDGITTKAKIVAKLDKVTSKEDLYALVILNNKTADGKLKVAMPTAPTETAPGQTYKAWNESTTKATTNDVGKAILDNEKGFYMANAPLYDKTNSKVTTLVQIKKNLIFPTEIKAAASEGNDIYVERGVAKVTMATVPVSAKTVTGGTYDGDNVDIEKWGLDVTNKKTYPVHKTDGTGYTDIWKFNTAASTVNGATIKRFFDSSSSCVAKRVYWGVDPNYSNNDLFDATKDTERGENFNYITKGGNVSTAVTGVQYCLENTFNLANMTQGQTTRVVFKAKYTPGTFTDGETFYKIGKNVKLWHEADLIAQIKAAVTVVAGASTAGTTIDVDLNATENKLTVAGNKVLATSNIKVNGAALAQPQVDAVNEKLGLTAESGISTFESGFTYYIARVKHFGDVLTPWKVDDPKYGDDNISFLGRYGMLRNNWYELTVNSVSGPGYPEVPTVKPTVPDDDDDKYVSVSVKVLDWAKRSQTVDL